MKKKTKAKEKDSRPNCDKCDKKATKNYQLMWVVWKVKKDGGYTKTAEPLCDLDVEQNLHYCDEHADKFEEYGDADYELYED